jgi:ion channel-forming bestrophin family protein
MIIKKNLSVKAIFEFTGHHLYWLTAWMLAISALYYATQWKCITIPWLPISVIGTAVAFYVGFKNSQSYNRTWEARQVWGSFVNDSRKLATTIKHFRPGQGAANNGEAIRKQIIYRHIAYLYQLREQLLEPAPWEHVSSAGRVGQFNRKRRNRNFGYYSKELEEIASRSYLSDEEKDGMQHFSNKAAHLLDLQTGALQQLFHNGSIDGFQHIKLQEIVHNFYDNQGRAERIKRFPFPRKYASFSFVFTCIFIFLLPFGIVGEFAELGRDYVWLSIPVGVIVGWIYVVMEMIGDYSENPFQGLHNDVPMLSISRTIEIDLLQTIGEEDIPAPIAIKNGVLF